MTTFLHAWLAAWLFVLGVSLGSLANLMVHALTGGRWAEPARPAWLAATRALPWIALLFLPLAAGIRATWPWTAAPDAWLDVPFFLARSAAYLVTWCVLGWGLRRGRNVRAWSAAGLVIYAFTISLASFDWIASLTPGWASSGFGLLIGVGQMLSGAAFGIAVAARRAGGEAGADLRQRFHDLGNLLLMYVLTWTYLAYTQFLVIWSENLPREISWYEPRLQGGWSMVALAVVVLGFALPLAILLARSAKRSPRHMFAIAALLLAVRAADVAWMVLPPIGGAGG